MKMTGTLPEDRYPSFSSRFRITTSPAIRAQGKAGRSKLSTAVFSACSALSCGALELSDLCNFSYILLSVCALPQSPSSPCNGWGKGGGQCSQLKGWPCGGCFLGRQRFAEEDLHPATEGSPQATAIWTPGTAESMRQCPPCLPLLLCAHALHAIALWALCAGLLRACYSTRPLSG